MTPMVPMVPTMPMVPTVPMLCTVPIVGTVPMVPMVPRARSFETPMRVDLGEWIGFSFLDCSIVNMSELVFDLTFSSVCQWWVIVSIGLSNFLYQS